MATDMMSEKGGRGVGMNAFKGSFEVPGRLHVLSEILEGRCRGETIHVEAGLYSRTAEGRDRDRLHGMRRLAPGVLEATLPTRDLLPEATVRAIDDAVRAPGAPAGATLNAVIGELLP